MNTRIRIVVLILFLPSLVSALVANPASGDHECKFYEAYISGDMDSWPGWIKELETSYKEEQDPDILYNLLVAYYGYVAYLIGIDADDDARRYLETGKKYLNDLEEYPAYASDAEALKGAFLAYEIGMSRSKAVWLGPRSMRHINKAVELDPNNPVAWMEKGNAEFHMPRIFGGSYSKAGEYFLKAVRLFEQSPSATECNWRYLNALAWLARSYDRAGNDEKAETTYQKILALEPDFKWVKEELYPEFKAKQ